MRLQTQILVFMICLNLATTVVVQLGVPGTGYTQPSNSTGTATQYEQRFNATEMGGNWQATNYGIPIIGDIFGAFYFFFNCIKFLLAGFPIMLWWIGDNFITDPAGRIAYGILITPIIALFAVMMGMYIIEFIGGRYLNE